MRIGCQIGLWPGRDVEFVARATGDLKAAGIETFTTHLKPYQSEPELLKNMLVESGVRLIGAYFNSKNFVQPGAESDVVKEAASFCATLRDVGGEYLVFNGGVSKKDIPRPFTDEEFAQFARILNRSADKAMEHSVGVVIHPHFGCMVETPEDVNRLIDAGVDREKVGLCVHAAHQYLAGADPYTIYEKHAGWVRYVHVGDVDSDGKGTFLGQGVLDQEKLMGFLLDAGFDGWIVIECSKDGVEPEAYAADAIAYIKRTWPALRWEE